MVPRSTQCPTRRGKSESGGICCANTAAGEHSSARANIDALNMRNRVRVQFFHSHPKSLIFQSAFWPWFAQFHPVESTRDGSNPQRPSPSARFDVLVHSEKVCRIVLLLDLHQSLECRAVSERDAIGLVLSQKVDVRAITRERLCFCEETTRPLDAARVLRGRLPASVHVHHVIGVSVRVGHCLGCYSAGLSADGADEDLALGRRQLGGVFDDYIDRAVAELCEIVRLPVIAGALRQ